ncbi:30S ribosomal protein S9 [Candidatus Woesearchaeota archaeon]|nr:30S ribosomal protein S9 [Candidatus Woesearchaeota archaeon]
MTEKKTAKKEEKKQIKVVHVSGSRKRSIARATLKDGKGIVRINSYLLNNYKPDFARDKIMEPLMIAGDLANKIDISINVKGGGWRSQSDAVRLAISRALVQYSGSKVLERNFLDYDRNLLIADIRRKEQYKPNDSKARAKRTKSKR